MGLASAGKDWILEQTLLAVEERGLERWEGKGDAGRAREMGYCGEVHGQPVRDWWAGCWSGCASEDEVYPGNLPCSFRVGSFILLVQERD